MINGNYKSKTKVGALSKVRGLKSSIVPIRDSCVQRDKKLTDENKFNSINFLIMQRLILLLLVIFFFGCSRKDFTDMNDIYIKDNIAYFIKDNARVNGKVRSYGYWKKPGVTAIFHGKKINYEGYYFNGLKDYKWLNFEPDKSLQKGRIQYIKKIKEIWNAGELLKTEYYDSSGNILESKYYNGSE